MGARLRHARLARGLYLKAVAQAAGCSESLLSKIENNKAQPSLRLLHRICAAFEMTMGDLLSAPSGGEHVVMRVGERPVVRFEERGAEIAIERLGPFGKGHLLQAYINRIPPGGSSGEAIAHDGEEVGYVICGDVELTVADRTFRLSAGDSFCFRSDRPHAYANAGPAEARVIIVNSPPSF